MGSIYNTRSEGVQAALVVNAVHVNNVKLHETQSEIKLPVTLDQHGDFQGYRLSKHNLYLAPPYDKTLDVM